MLFKRSRRSISSIKSAPVLDRKTALAGFWEELVHCATAYKNVVILNNGLPRDFFSADVPRAFGERYIDLGSFSLGGLGQAIGMVLAGKKPIVLGKPMDLAGHGWGLLCDAVGDPRLNLKCVGIGSDFLADIELMKAIPNMSTVAPRDYLQARDVAKELCGEYGPTYVQLR